SLNWTRYRFPDPDVYEIWFSKDGGAFQKAGEVKASDSVFIHNNVSNGVSYVYYVYCKFATGSSTTCQKAIRTYEYIEPQFVYLANADVLPSNEIELAAEVDLDIVAGAWEVYRTAPGASAALKIATINRTEVNTNPLVYLDADTDPSVGPYSYFIKALDSCGFEKLESNTLKTIHLTGIIVDDKTNSLQWTPFEGWLFPVEKYYIFRMMGDQEPLLPIDSVDAQTFSYTDDYSSLGNVDGRFVYWVQAKDGTYGVGELSRSNRLQLFLESQVYFANAFKPGGVNSVFKPIFRFFSGTVFTFQIYNRWGQLIFESTDPEKGWTGDVNGKPAAQGIYIYHFSYQDVYGKSVVMRGTVTLLK
ncbi:MAG: gliding motility-associated C-terminal domain-containing protein, partial [Bacteroidales bacterium]|nr:gliding motility-associated C-terminal domain-containing protein [Bacteroidales bacterium]